MSGTNYTTSLRLAKPVPGNPAVRNTWGATLDTDMDLIDASIAGASSVALTGATATLTAVNGAADQSRPAVVVFTGTPGVTCTVTVPAVSKFSWFLNSCSDDSNVVLTTGSGTTVTVAANGTYYLVRCDGTNMTKAQVGSTSDLAVPWTPALTFGGAAVGMTGTVAGYLVKTGLLVNFTASLILTAKGSSTGTAIIGGLPYLPSGYGNFQCGVGFWANFRVGLTGPPTLVVKANFSPSGKIDLFDGSTKNTATVLTDADFTDTTNLYFTGFYFADS